MHITFELILFILLIWLLIYILVDRICRCIEHGHIADSYNKSLEASEKEEQSELQSLKRGCDIFMVSSFLLKNPFAKFTGTVMKRKE